MTNSQHNASFNKHIEYLIDNFDPSDVLNALAEHYARLAAMEGHPRVTASYKAAADLCNSVKDHKEIY